MDAKHGQSLMLAGAALALLAACATPPPPGATMIGKDIDTLAAAYGPPGSQPPDGSAGQIVFVRAGRAAIGSGMERDLRRCDRLGVAAGVEDINPSCENRSDWTSQYALVSVPCVMTFTLSADGRVDDFTAEPPGCDTALAPR